MRKITFLIGLLFIVAIGFAQKPMSLKGELSKTRDEKRLDGKGNSKSLTVEITADHGYVAGTTMMLDLTLVFETPDLEYGDLLEITFPAGIVPISGQNPLAVTTEDQAPENFIGIIGQKITWGDNDNNYGGIEPGEHSFWVEVTIDAEVTGKQTVEFYVSGDTYGAAPNEYSGTFKINAMATSPDLTIKPAGFMATYFAVPFDQVKAVSQVTSTIQAYVSNMGTELTEATKVSVKTDGGFMVESDLDLPFMEEENRFVVFDDFMAATTGDYTFTYTAEAANDFDPENGVATATISVNETDLIRDNGVYDGSFGVGSGGGDFMGNTFTINNKDTLNSVTVYLASPTLGDILSMHVFSLDENGTPETMIASSIEMVITGEDQEFTFYFTGEGVILEPGEYLFAIKEDVNNMSLVITTTPYVDGAGWVFYQGAWTEIGPMGFPFIFYIRPGFGTELPAFDIELLSLDMYKYELVGDVTIEGTLLNKGVTPLTSIDISYTVNGGTPVTETLSGLSVSGLYNFELATPVTLTEVGDFDIVVTISNANGAPDADVTNDSKEVMVSALEYAPAKNILGEEATGTWCQWCTRGHVFMDYMEENYPDTWIGVAVHNSDPMVVTAYDNGIGNYIAGYPSGLVNRMGEFDPSQFEDAYEAMINLPSPVDMSIGNVELTGTTLILTFDVSAKFLATLNGARFNAVIVENGVTGSTSAYNQANAYSGGANGPMGGYENLPNPVLAEDMVYQNVARAILGGWDGTAGSIPATVSNGDNATYSYSVELSSDWNTEEIVIVGMVIGDDGSILNSIKAKMPQTQVNLTFKVNLTAYSTLTATDKVYVTGDFGMIEMSSTDGDNFEATVAVAANKVHYYSYVVNSNVIWDGLSVTVADVDVTVEDVYVGLNEKVFANVQLFPNPFNGTLTVSNLNNASELVVTNVLGQTVLSLPVTQNNMQINTQNLNEGVYLITILDNENNSRIMRVIKQ